MAHGELEGLYHSSADAREWVPDADVGGFNHLLFSEGSQMAGIWRADPASTTAPAPVEIPARETILVLEGSVTVTVDGGEARVLRGGDMISMPARSIVGWDPAPDCLVFWVYS